MRAEKIYHVSHYFGIKRLKPIAKVFDVLNYLVHNSYIPSGCTIGKDSIFAYGGISVVIHPGAKIGNHCMICQGVTIGGKSGGDFVPVIEDNVFVGPGVVILGNVKIGHDSIIGANAVVLEDVLPYSVVGGIPARLLSTINKENFESKYHHYYGPLNYAPDKPGI